MEGRHRAPGKKATEQYRERMLVVWARRQGRGGKRWGFGMHFEGRGKYLGVGVDLVHRKGEFRRTPRLPA